MRQAPACVGATIRPARRIESEVELQEAARQRPAAECPAARLRAAGQRRVEGRILTGAHSAARLLQYRNDALLQGTVVHVSADRLVERGSNVPYYGAIIEVGAAEFDQAESAVQLQAGMPAEVYIEGSKQTPLQYLAEPVVATWRKAGRQM